MYFFHKVAFLASAVGPRVAAACANAALCVLTKEDSRYNAALHTLNQLHVLK